MKPVDPAPVSVGSVYGTLTFDTWRYVLEADDGAKWNVSLSISDKHRAQEFVGKRVLVFGQLINEEGRLRIETRDLPGFAIRPA